MSEYPLNVFRFRVDFYLATEASNQQGNSRPLCSSAFSECSGLEVTMEPKSIKEGGNNCKQIHRAGRVSFGTIILKRGLVKNRDLWKWFELVNQRGAYAFRLNVKITLLDFNEEPEGRGLMTWVLGKALPTKFKTADLNAKSNEVGIEELHFVYEEIGHIYRRSESDA